MRARIQSSRIASFETFEIDQLRDVIDAATGRPLDVEAWGHRISGSDALSLSLELPFDEIAQLCMRIETTHRADDYRARFPWLDHIQPVADADVLARLRDEVIARLREGSTDELDLAPPQIIEWERVDHFRYSADGHQRLDHRQLRLSDFIRALNRTGRLDGLTYGYLDSARIKALDGDGDPVHQWPVSRALFGTLVVEGTTYIVDEGQFFTVARDFLEEIDLLVDRLPSGGNPLPSCGVGQHERSYNEYAAAATGCLLMDRQQLNVPNRTTPVELCDLLTRNRDLIHVKREFGSRDLSHMYSQGTTSAELVQEEPDFRREVQKRVQELAGDDSYAFFEEGGIQTPEFRVVYAVIGDWRGRKPSEALPFFSKLNLRRAVRDLSRRGFQVGLQRVDQDLDA